MPSTTIAIREGDSDDAGSRMDDTPSIQQMVPKPETLPRLHDCLPRLPCLERLSLGSFWIVLTYPHDKLGKRALQPLNPQHMAKRAKIFKLAPIYRMSGETRDEKIHTTKVEALDIPKVKLDTSGNSPWIGGPDHDSVFASDRGDERWHSRRGFGIACKPISRIRRRTR